MTLYAEIRDDKVFHIVDTTTAPDPTVNQVVGTTYVKCTKTIKRGIFTIPHLRSSQK